MMITKDKSSYDVNVKALKSGLYKCVEYCNNEHECRRTMQLAHFGEMFGKEKCGKTCDNCQRGATVEAVDMTKEAKEILRYVFKHFLLLFLLLLFVVHPSEDGVVLLLLLLFFFLLFVHL